MIRLDVLHRCIILLAALTSIDPMASLAVAQHYPSQAIHLVVPSAAGTPPDIISRMIGNEVGKSRGWQVIVENKPGAMQTIGAADVFKRPADGYTLVGIALASAVAPALLPHVPFRLDADFAPIVKLATAYHVLVVNPSVPAHSLAELIALLKANPDKLTFSSGGFGSPAHLAGELLKLKTGVRATHIPYGALPHAIGDLLNGTNQFQFITPLPVLDLISAGKLRALAVTAPARMSKLKDIPTVVEEGFPDLIIQDFIGLVAKAGTPPEIVGEWNRAANAALSAPRVREAFARMSAETAGGTPEEFGAFLQGQMSYWRKIIDDAGIKMHQ